jgi:hypothetical protein
MSVKETTTTINQPAKQASANLEAAIERVRIASRGLGKEVFVARILHAVAHIATEMDERLLTAVSGAPSDYAVLLQVLEEPEALALMAEDPLTPAKLRGLRQREELLRAEGGTISAEAAANLLRLTRQAVDKRRRVGRLIGLSTGRRGYAYPSWQFNSEGGTLQGLETILAELKDHDPWMQTTFMLSPNMALDGETPLAGIRRGELDRVRHAALLYGEHGAV